MIKFSTINKKSNYKINDYKIFVIIKIISK